MTFASRGVAAPFTTPLLAGTRIRRSPNAEVELVAPNPSGSRGVYVRDWLGVRALCSPTVHDTLLLRRCGRLDAITPASIRETALEIAAEGHAGRDAARAALTALALDRQQALLAHALLLTELTEQREAGGRDRTPPPHPIDPSPARSAATLTGALHAIATLFAPVGLTASPHHARIPQFLGRLAQAHIELAGWLNADPANDLGGLGQAVATALHRAGETGTAALERTRSLLTDKPALLRRWIKDRDSVLTGATRCDWLLDGWERVILLWSAATTTATRRAALLEMAPLVPVLPREAALWTDIPIAPDSMRQACRVISHDDAWRTGGSAFALIARNETLIAASARAAIPPPRRPDGPRTT